MNTFVKAVNNAVNQTVTENGMPALRSSGKDNVDLFYNVGAMRGQDVLKYFVPAYMENAEVALRVAAWSRDVRGGAGEREHFRNILRWLEAKHPAQASRLMKLVPEIGRWDDLLVFETVFMREQAFDMIQHGLESGDGLCAKWMPRKGKDAAALREYLKMSPKQYRKTLVGLTKVVETQMCAQDWENINFNHVPSLASIRYGKAFMRNATKAYTEWKASLARGDAGVKVNAAAVYPYQVLAPYLGYARVSKDDAMVDAQWEALPNYLDENKGNSIFPMVDVSGSMSAPCGPKAPESCMDVAVSLGLYTATKNKGPFQDLLLTFSANPEIFKLKGSLRQKVHQIRAADWGMNTNLEAAFKRLLEVAKKGKAKASDMPKTLLIFSDMQFDQCVDKASDKALDMIKRQYEDAGYTMPNVVFWNLRSTNNMPAKANAKGVSLVSGFSPAVMQAVLGAESFSPEAVMLKAVMVDRYAM